MLIHLFAEPKFPFGKLVATRNAVDRLSSEDMSKALFRHGSCDWGDLCDEDRTANDQALEGDLRLLSSYTSANGVKFWIITEWDRSVTTILLPEDY